MIKQKTVYNFFKFLEDEKGEKIPFDVKLSHFPHRMTKEDFSEKNNYLEYNILFEPESISEEDLNVEGNMDLSELPVYKLPDNLYVNGDLNLSLTTIEKLPNNLTVTGKLNIANTSIMRLPHNIKIGKSLSCDGSEVRYLSDNLSLEVLDISFTRIQKIPYNLRVDTVYAYYSFIKDKYTTKEKFKNAVKEKGGYVEIVYM